MSQIVNDYLWLLNKLTGQTYKHAIAFRKFLRLHMAMSVSNKNPVCTLRIANITHMHVLHQLCGFNELKRTETNDILGKIPVSKK